MNGQLYRTTTGNAGSQQTYTEIDGGTFGSHFVSAIAVDSSNADTAYVTLGSYCACYNNQGGYVYKTTDAGAHWTNIPGSLPNYPINAPIEYHSGGSNVVVVGTDYGVYYTSNDGSTWTALNNGLPNVSVVDLSIDQAQTALGAWTHGRSAWSTSIPAGGSGTYNPTVTLTYKSLAQNKPDSISGTGFKPNETVNALYAPAAGGTPQQLTTTSGTNATGMADGSGNVSAITFKVPQVPAGSYHIILTGATSNASAFDTFTMLQAIVLKPKSGARGSSVTITGTGFGAGDTHISILWNCSATNCSKSKTLTAPSGSNSKGDFTVTKTVPTTGVTSGKGYSIAGKGTSSAVAAYARYSVTG